MNKSEQITLAANLLGWTIEKATKLCNSQMEIGALYFCDKSKGGGSLLMGSDGSVLFANSSVSPAEHKKAFVNGKRTALNEFHKK